jgi:hypothetical protein
LSEFSGRRGSIASKIAKLPNYLATNPDGIPQNRFKLGADYWITPKWKFGGDLAAASGQFFFGDESNQDKHIMDYLAATQISRPRSNFGKTE